jgi:Kef-type K+ transport system membrane component KefB
MKALMILGAIVGFLIGAGCGIAGDSPWSATLWRACAAALVAAVLARWWGRVWFNSLRNSLEHGPGIRPAPRSDSKSAAKV